MRQHVFSFSFIFTFHLSSSATSVCTAGLKKEHWLFVILHVIWGLSIFTLGPFSRSWLWSEEKLLECEWNLFSKPWTRLWKKSRPQWNISCHEKGHKSCRHRENVSRLEESHSICKISRREKRYSLLTVCEPLAAAVNVYLPTMRISVMLKGKEIDTIGPEHPQVMTAHSRAWSSRCAGLVWFLGLGRAPRMGPMSPVHANPLCMWVWVHCFDLLLIYHEDYFTNVLFIRSVHCCCIYA